MPGRKKLPPIRWSAPIPLLTSSTFAPTASQRLATGLMKEILMARKAFEACLIYSALLALVTINSVFPFCPEPAGTASLFRQYAP